MLSSQKFALAAHMHVLLRRKTGRVTDTEWMVANTEYAREIVRVARARLAEGPDAELEACTLRMEAMLAQEPANPEGGALQRLRERAAGPAGPRYVGGLR